MRPDGPKIEAEGRERGGVLGEGQQARPARESGSDVNKTKFLRLRPPEVNKGTWRIKLLSKKLKNATVDLHSITVE